MCQLKLSPSTVVSAARAAIGKILTQLLTCSCSRKLSAADSTCDRADGVSITCHLFDEFAMPNLEREQCPDPWLLIAIAGRMVIEQFAYRCPVEHRPDKRGQARQMAAGRSHPRRNNPYG